MLYRLHILKWLTPTEELNPLDAFENSIFAFHINLNYENESELVDICLY